MANYKIRKDDATPCKDCKVFLTPKCERGYTSSHGFPCQSFKEAVPKHRAKSV